MKKITYDPKVDAAYLTVRPHRRVSKTVEFHGSVLLDYRKGKLVGIEFLHGGPIQPLKKTTKRKGCP